MPGLAFLLGFYLLTIARLWPLARHKVLAADEWLPGAAAMVIAGLFGFMTAAQFVSLVGLELPYYVALVGAGVLGLQSRAVSATDWDLTLSFDGGAELDLAGRGQRRSDRLFPQGIRDERVLHALYGMLLIAHALELAGHHVE